LIDVWAGMEQIVIKTIAWPVAQTHPSVHSSQKRTFWIFKMTQISQKVVNCNECNGVVSNLKYAA